MLISANWTKATTMRPGTSNEALTGNFVALALLDAAVAGLTANIAMLVGSPGSTTGNGGAGQRSPALPLASALADVALICAQLDIQRADSLVCVMAQLDAWFADVLLECNEPDALLAREAFLSTLEAARSHALAALDEAGAGFPMSGGSYPKWKAASRSTEGRPKASQVDHIAGLLPQAPC